MVICGSYMSEFSVNKDIKKNNDEMRSPSYLLTLIVKKIEISVEQSRVVTTLSIIKY